MIAAIFLGGPSLKTVDLAAVKADVKIGCNWSFDIPGVSFNVVLDYRHMDGENGVGGMQKDPAYQKWLLDGGYGIFIDHCIKKSQYPNTDIVKSTFPVWPVKPARWIDGLYGRSNVGLSALSLACLLAEEVHIYGLDLTETASGKTENYHTKHNPAWTTPCKAPYESMVEGWKEAFPKIPKSIRIINFNPASAIKLFPFADEGRK